MLGRSTIRALAIAGTALALAHGGGFATEPATTVAIVSDAVGDAFVVVPRRRGDVPVSVLSELSAGELLRLEPGCRLVIAFTGSGQSFELEGGGRFLIGRDSVEPLDRSGRLRALARDLTLRMLS